MDTHVFERYLNPDAAPSSFVLQRDGKPVGIGSVREIEYGMVRTMSGAEVLGKAADLATVYEYVEKVRSEKTLNQHLINFTINTNTLDRSNDIIEPAGIDLKKYERNNVLFWNHNTWGMPIGSGFLPTLGDSSITMDFNFHGLSDEKTLSETVGLLCLARVIKACSIGVIPLQWDDVEIDDNVRALYSTVYPSWSTKIRRYKKSEMIECSPCSIPMNPDAVQASFGGLAEEEMKALVAKGIFNADNPLFNILSRAVSRPPQISSLPEGEQKAGAKISSERLQKLKQAHQVLGDVIAEVDTTTNDDDVAASHNAPAKSQQTSQKGVSGKQYDRDMRLLITSLAEIKGSIEKLVSETDTEKDTGTDPALLQNLFQNLLQKRKDDLRELLFGSPNQFMNDDKSKDTGGGEEEKSETDETYSDAKALEILNRLNVQ